MKILIAFFLGLLLPLVASANGLGAPAKALSEEQKIDALIVSVEKLPGAVFIRNGSEYDAVKAAAHLRLKRENAGRKVRTAEDFIRYCGSASSMSGKKYQIRFADGRTVYAGDFFHQQLRRIEAGPAPVTLSGRAPG